MPEKELPNFPATADLCAEVFQPLPVVDELPVEVREDGGAGVCEKVLSALSDSLASNSADLAGLFATNGAYWRDTLAFTYHLRTFNGREAIAKALYDLNPQRQSRGFKVIEGTAAAVTGGPSLVSAKSVQSYKLPVSIGCGLNVTLY